MATKPAPPRHEWSWDENVLLIDAHHHIQQHPHDRDYADVIIRSLARDLQMSFRKVRNGVQAVARSRNHSNALAILMQWHPVSGNGAGLRLPRVAAEEAKKIRRRLGLLPT